MNKKKIAIIALIVILVVVVAIEVILGKAHKYKTEKAVKHTIQQIVEASGTVNPVNTVSVGSTVSGLMKEVYVDFNSKVKAGQLIALMDTSLLQANVDKTRSNYDKQKAITDNSLKTYN